MQGSSSSFSAFLYFLVVFDTMPSSPPQQNLQHFVLFSAFLDAFTPHSCLFPGRKAFSTKEHLLGFAVAQDTAKPTAPEVRKAPCSFGGTARSQKHPTCAGHHGPQRVFFPCSHQAAWHRRELLQTPLKRQPPRNSVAEKCINTEPSAQGRGWGGRTHLRVPEHGLLHPEFYFFPPKLGAWHLQTHQAKRAVLSPSHAWCRKTNSRAGLSTPGKPPATN